MRKEIAFIIVMTVFGLLSGAMLAALFAAIASPNILNFILTFQEKADAELWNNSILNMKTAGFKFLGALTALTGIVAWLLFIFNINPNFKNMKSKDHRSGTKILKVIISLIALTFVFLGFILTFLQIEGGLFFTGAISGSGSGVSLFFLYIISAGIAWLIAGESGWAADFKSWKTLVRHDKLRLFSVLLLGIFSGLCAYLVTMLCSWVFNNYFVLQISVFAKSPDLMTDSFQKLASGFALIHGISFAVIAGFITALAPVQTVKKERLKKLIFPVGLLLLILAVITPAYKNADKKYDLAKKNLAEALGVPEKATVIKTVVLLIPDKNKNQAIIQEWPLEITSWGGLKGGSIELSYQNLEKAEKYLTSRTHGSVFKYSVEDALANGYLMLWDIKKGLEWQSRTQSTLLQRMIFIAHIRSLPITPDTLLHLKKYTDKSKWHIGSRAAMRLAEGFFHFGIIDEGKALLEKARQSGAAQSEIDKIKIPQKPVLIDGKIFGTVMINNKPAANAKIALLSYKYTGKLSSFSASQNLTDAQTIDANGRFSFKNLGQKEYFLAIMTDKETIPYTLQPKDITVKHLPGVIKLDSKNSSVNTGVIGISFKK